MKKTNHIKTNTTRTIKKTFPRFISLVVMSLLGVMVYVGLQATSPDMLKTLDNYYDKKDVYDINIISTMGLIEDDIKALEKLPNIKNVEGTTSEDILLTIKNNEYVINISSLPSNINKLTLLKGKLPKKDNEIVIEENFLKNHNYKIGDTLTIESETLLNKEYKIVGTVESPLYFNSVKGSSQTRGTSTKGTGFINYYSYILPSSFTTDYYTNIYITLSNTKKEITSKQEYLSIIEDITKEINNIKSTQENNRYQKIYNEALSKIEEKEEELNKELSKVENDLSKAKKELDKAKKELTTASSGLNTYKKELSKAKEELAKANNSYNNALKEYNIKEEEIPTNIEVLKSNISNLESLLTTISPSTEEYYIYEKELNTLKSNLSNLETLLYTKEQLSKGEKEYTSNLNKYNTLNNQYKKGLSSYNSGLSKYNKGLKEYNKGKLEAKEKIAEAKEELTKIEQPKWYLYDRSDNQTYSSYVDQTVSIKNLSAIFPLVFYGVAILVSLISMNRMVEDDRGEIGTLKSLGFTNKEIITKYIRFSLLATLLGGIIGLILGLTIIPYLIFVIYKMLFTLPNFYIGLNLSMSITGILIAIICICGAAIITATKVLKDNPAILMRPKPPKSGKRILLERIKFFWHNLNFSQKVTIRNLFRYKKRVFVTLFGITGCTALMLCGFGIKDSIVDITHMQYEETFTYNAVAYTNNLNLKETPDIFNNQYINEYILTEQISATYEKSNITMLIVDSNESLSKIVNTYNKDNKKVSLKENQVLITDKLADIYNLKIGDTINILDSEKNSYTLTISEIVKNYMGHYIYINKSTIEEYKEYKPNTVYLKTDKLSSKEKDLLSEQLLKHDSIMNVIHMETFMKSTEDMLNSLDKIIIVLIILSASLSFVVLYNLSNINITERKREIATLKVLGFFNKEVDNYITKENLILTIIGIIFGLIFGNILTYATIGTVEMENTRFLREITIQSYIYTSIISFVFTIIVNYVTHFSLKKINMIESLKSVE